MSARVALCLDDATRRNPQIAGLAGESLDGQPWLEVHSAGDEARQVVAKSERIEEAWVVSSDDVEPINLAATLKADRPDIVVRLVTAERDGSLLSRASTAFIDEVVDYAGFARRYAEAKQEFSQAQPRSSLAPTLSKPDAPKGSRAFIMPVVSGSGGAGKSSVAVMGAHIARNLGYRTLLLDYDLQFGDAAIMAGVEGAIAIDEAIARPDLFERELKGNSGLVVLAAPTRLETADQIVRDTPQFLEGLASAFDVVVANTGSAWADQHIILLERCSAALFLIDQRASSVRACRHALELCARCGIASGPFQFAVNRCAKNAPLTSIDVSCALQGVPVFELKDGGRDVEDYLGGGAAAELLASRNEFCTSLQHVMESLLPGGARPGEAPADPPDVRRAGKKGRHAGRRLIWGAS